MKKLFALILAIALMATVSITVFAENNTISYDDSVQESGMTVSYKVEPTYTVTIPTQVTLGSTAEVKVEDVVIPKGYQVEVSICDEDDFVLTSGEGAEIYYSVTCGDEEYYPDDVILAVSTTVSTSGSTILTFEASSDIQYAGDYTGTVTFVISQGYDSYITFLVGVEYIAEKWMTWEEWVASPFNTAGFTVSEGQVMTNSGYIVWDYEADSPVAADGYIEGDTSYGMGSWG
jgi:hypothetical protein